MYANSQASEHTHDMPLQMKAENAFGAAKKSKRSNPYEGAPLQVSGKLASRIKQSFGINAGELKLRESREVAEMGAKATAQGDAVRFAPGQFRPDTREGMEILGHELNHVREQATNGVNAPGGEVFEHPRHEAASDKAGEAFASGSLASAPVSVGGISAQSAPVQGLFGRGRRRRQRREIQDLRELLSSRYANQVVRDNERMDPELSKILNSQHQMDMDMAEQRLAELTAPKGASWLEKKLMPRRDAPTSLSRGPADPRIANEREARYMRMGIMPQAAPISASFHSDGSIENAFANIDTSLTRQSEMPAESMTPAPRRSFFGRLFGRNG